MPKLRKPGVPRFFLAALALLVAAGIPLAADAKTLYKLVDKNGKVTYVDKVPKGFDGEVTEIAIDAPPPPSPTPPPPVPRASSAAQEQQKRDINTERKEARAKLQAALDAAREKLDAAKKALAEGGEIAEDEFQVIQQRIAAQKNVPAPRSNCFQQPGAMVWICPVMTPGEKYRDRQKGLEDAVRAAEAELEAAEIAYRRGTD